MIKFVSGSSLLNIVAVGALGWLKSGELAPQGRFPTINPSSFQDEQSVFPQLDIKSSAVVKKKKQLLRKKQLTERKPLLLDKHVTNI